MRKTVSALMTVVVLMAILEPFATAAYAKSLPACCRRDGMHHCMMTHAEMSSAENSSTAVGTLPQTCPIRRSVRSTATGYFTLPPQTPLSFLLRFSAVVAHESLVFLSAGFSSHTDRGQPAVA
ncbi:MAG: hypothetical protein ACRD3E_06060 [Terriglobales bacterium]